MFTEKNRICGRPATRYTLRAEVAATLGDGDAVVILRQTRDAAASESSSAIEKRSFLL